MKRALATITLFSLAALACGPPDDGFRFDGEYSAPRSGFSLSLVCARFSPARAEAAAAFAVAQVCPAGSPDGRPFRMTFTAEPGGPVRLEAGALGPVAMEWNDRSAEGLLRGLLTSAGFRNIDAGELGECLAALGRSLARPQGDVEETAGSLRTIREEVTEGYGIDRDAPPAEWVPRSDFPECN